MSLEQALKTTIRDIPDFPKPGVVFKDITPVLADPGLVTEIKEAFTRQALEWQVEVIAGIDARGFLFGLMIAEAMQIPFVPIRKQGKLPGQTIRVDYQLEYGNATIEMHTDGISKGQRVLVHDDLLATGGTAAAAAELIKNHGGKVAGFSFLVGLSFLPGLEALARFDAPVQTLIRY